MSNRMPVQNNGSLLGLGQYHGISFKKISAGAKSAHLAFLCNILGPSQDQCAHFCRMEYLLPPHGSA
jgi:hypothetical protein